MSAPLTTCPEGHLPPTTSCGCPESPPPSSPAAGPEATRPTCPEAQVPRPTCPEAQAPRPTCPQAQAPSPTCISAPGHHAPLATSPALHLTRRDLLRGAAAALALAPAAALAAPAPPPPDDADLFDPAPETVLQIDLPQLQHPGRWNPRPGAMRELALELRLRTRLEPLREPTTVKADSPRLFATPFLYVAGEGALPDLGPAAEQALARFIDLGGMIVFDAADGGADLGFEQGVRALLARIAPGAPLARVAAEHVLYRSFYLIDTPLGRTATYDHVLGIEDEGRLKVLLCRNDLGGALARGEGGLWSHPCVPGGAMQREWAFRFAVNVLLYATCTDYKADRAHVETLLHNRRWR